MFSGALTGYGMAFTTSSDKFYCFFAGRRWRRTDFRVDLSFRYIPQITLPIDGA